MPSAGQPAWAEQFPAAARPHVAAILSAAEETGVDARLIAAAPEMLEALEKCLNFISNTEGEIGEDLICGNAARAAIAKATGEDA